MLAAAAASDAGARCHALRYDSLIFSPMMPPCHATPQLRRYHTLPVALMFITYYRDVILFFGMATGAYADTIITMIR